MAASPERASSSAFTRGANSVDVSRWRVDGKSGSSVSVDPRIELIWQMLFCSLAKADLACDVRIKHAMDWLFARTFCKLPDEGNSYQLNPKSPGLVGHPVGN